MSGPAETKREPTIVTASQLDTFSKVLDLMAALKRATIAKENKQ